MTWTLTSGCDFVFGVRTAEWITSFLSLYIYFLIFWEELLFCLWFVLFLILFCVCVSVWNNVILNEDPQKEKKSWNSIFILLFLLLLSFLSFLKLKMHLWIISLSQWFVLSLFSGWTSAQVKPSLIYPEQTCHLNQSWSKECDI